MSKYGKIVTPLRIAAKALESAIEAIMVAGLTALVYVALGIGLAAGGIVGVIGVCALIACYSALCMMLIQSMDEMIDEQYPNPQS